MKLATTLALVLAAGAATAQQTIRVPSDAPNLTLALDPLAFGIAPGDTIVLEAGSVNAGTFSVTTPGITIRGEGPAPVVVNAFNTGPVFTVDVGSEAVTFDNVRFTNGSNPGGPGGGISVVSCAQLNVFGCAFEDNSAETGGGIHATNTDITIDGTSFVNCDANLGGGAIRAGGSGVDLLITNSTFSGCVVAGPAGGTNGTGGAISHVGGGSTFIVDSCEFASNTSTVRGGAIFMNTTGYASISRTMFSDNTSIGGSAREGGAVWLEGVNQYDIRDCDFLRNVARGQGGAVAYRTASGDVTDCRFIDNESSDGGALGVIGSSGTVFVYNSVFDRNSARRAGTGTNSGGAIFVESTTSNESSVRVFNSLFTSNTAVNGGAINASEESFMFIDNSTFWNNDADTNGGAVWRSAATSDTLLNNCIFHENLPADDQVRISGSGLHQANYCHFDLPYTQTGVGNLDGDPMLADPSSGDFSLAAGSPAIDSGDTTRYGGPGSPDSRLSSDPARYTGPGSDLALNPRFQDDPGTPDTGVAIIGAVVDMGAFEYAPPATSACPADVNGDGLASPADFTAWLSAFNMGCP